MATRRLQGCGCMRRSLPPLSGVAASLAAAACRRPWSPPPLCAPLVTACAGAPVAAARHRHPALLAAAHHRSPPPLRASLAAATQHCSPLPFSVACCRRCLPLPPATARLPLAQPPLFASFRVRHFLLITATREPKKQIPTDAGKHGKFEKSHRGWRSKSGAQSDAEQARKHTTQGLARHA